MRSLLALGTVLLLAANARGATTKPAAATAPPGPAPFTSEQAYQGRFDYIHDCGECHAGDLGGQFGPALRGPDSNVPWQTPAAVWSFMTQQMPVGNAGGLPQSEYIDIEAFLLQQNGRKPGRERLTAAAIQADPLALDGTK
jgi:mono/diheme cytochrome c family protein